jgi:hypothetical protein
VSLKWSEARTPESFVLLREAWPKWVAPTWLPVRAVPESDSPCEKLCERGIVTELLIVRPPRGGRPPTKPQVLKCDPPRMAAVQKTL